MSRHRRYRKFSNAKSRAAFLDALARGLPVTAACKAAGWYQPDVYRWRKEDETFAEQWQAALDAGIDLLEQVALQRATVGQEIKIADKDGNVVGIERTMPSDTLLIFLLKAKRPDVYRETYRYDVTNSDNSLVAFAKAMNMLEDPEYQGKLPPPIDVTPERLIHAKAQASTEATEAFDPSAG